MGLFSGWHLGSPKADKFPIEQFGAKFPLTDDVWRILSEDSTFSMNLYLSDSFLGEFVKHEKLTQEEANTLALHREVLKDKEKFFKAFFGYVQECPILLDFEDKSVVTLAWWLERMVMINGYRKYKKFIDKQLRTRPKTKDPDMKCWNCDKLINHKKVKWEKRTYTAESIASNSEQLEASKKLAKVMGRKPNEEIVASPNRIFGVYEYEYRGKCPECKSELTCFWHGENSFNEIRGIIAVPKHRPFSCMRCKKEIEREYQVWYSARFVDDDEIKEHLITLCPNCKEENGSPFEYDFNKGIIE